jgi:phosphoadenosine phosphosulfate reductase
MGASESIKTLTATEVEYWADHLEHAHPQEILVWAVDTFGRDISLASSFGAEDMCLIDMLRRATPTPRVFYLDTGVLFPETYQLIDETIARYRFQPERVLPILTLEQQAEHYGQALWSRDPDTCCGIRKVEPLKRYLSGVKAWITGIRRDQTPFRANAKVIERDQKFGVIKLNPLARWTEAQVWEYIHAHQVPYNPLHDQGYPSIGCVPCTRAVKPGEDPRAGRWAGTEKTECGLHLDDGEESGQ